MSECNIPNTMNFIVQVSCDAINTNISSTVTAETGSNQTNDSLTELNTAWTTCTEANSGDPGNAIYLALQTAKAGGQAKMDAFITNNFLNKTNSSACANELSSAFITSVIIDLQGAYANFKPSKSTPGSLSTDLAACNAMNTLISSTSTNESQPEQTVARTYGSIIQQCQSAISVYSGIGDLANDCNGSIIALISQQY